MSPRESSGVLREERRGEERNERRVREKSSFSDARPRRSPAPVRRTYSRADWLAAQQAWEDGEFSDEWRPWRHKAAMVGGIISPPDGTKWDSWEDDQPSQRAILVRAMRETPKLLETCLPGAGWWSKVIERLIDKRDDWRADLRASEVRQSADEERPTSREAAMTLKAILTRISDS